MGIAKAVLVLVPVLVVFLGFKINSLLQPPPLPQLEDTWWGSGSPRDPSDKRLYLTPFNISVPDKDLKDLKWRLENHRPLTPPLQGVQQQYGMNTNLLKDVVEYWKTKYNWRQREQYLNKFPQYHLNVQGLEIHVVHVNPIPEPGTKVVPLLLLHGWPGSLREFFEFIPILNKPTKGRKFMFEVIAPHIPGFGFSQATNKTGLGPAQLAVLFKNLMHTLGFDRFYTQGGDFGSAILQHMAVLFPDSVLGYHSNMCTIYTPKSYLRTLLSTVFPSWYVKPEHYDRVFPLAEKFMFMVRESGYFHLQATKPDTVGVGLNDSPVGLAAYILEKFVTGTNFSYQERDDGGLKEHFSYEALIDNLMIYWVTGSATTSARLYAETMNIRHLGLGIIRRPVQVPVACARFSNDFYTADGLLDEIFPHLLQLTDYEGGHFAAFQYPEVLANDLHTAVEKFEEFNLKFRNITSSRT